MATLGWMFSAAGIASLLGDRPGLAISWVRPYATDKNLRPDLNNPADDTLLAEVCQEEEVEITGASIVESHPEIAAPWNWLLYGVVKWRLYSWTGDSFNQIGANDVRSRSGLDGMTINEQSTILAQIEAEILEKSKDSKTAMSSNPDLLEEKHEKGYVNAMAPLCQLVSPISNGVLKLGHFIDLEDNPGDARLLALPVFQLEDGRLIEPTQPWPIVNTDNRYEAVAGVSDYPDFELGPGMQTLQVVVETCLIVDHGDSTDRPEIDLQREALARRVFGLLGTALSPLSFANAIASGSVPEPRNEAGAFEFVEVNAPPPVTESWPTFLVNCLGNGWLLDDLDTPEDDHVLTVITTRARIKELFGTERLAPLFPKAAWSTRDIRHNFLADFKQPNLSALKPSGEFWLALSHLFDATHPSSNSADPQALVDTWTTAGDWLLDPDRAAGVVADWLCYLIDRKRLQGAYTNDLVDEVRGFMNPIIVEECLHRALETSFALQPDTRNQIIDGLVDEQGSTVKYGEFLAGTLAHLLPGVEDDIARLIAVHKSAIKQESEDAPVARDDGKPISIEGSSRDVVLSDVEIRGYAIGLMASLDGDVHHEPRQIVEREWITNTHITCYTSMGQGFVVSTPSDDPDEAPTPTIGNAAVGSASINGIDITEALYDGAPLCSMLGSAKDNPSSDGPAILHDEWDTVDNEFDLDETNSLDYGWYRTKKDLNSQALPLGSRIVPLGFGMRYWGLGTAILNNGMIEDARFRIPGREAALVDIDRVGTSSLDWSYEGRYLSFEAIGVPATISMTATTLDTVALSKEECFGFSNQSRTSEYLAARATKDPGSPDPSTPVGLLVPPNEPAYRMGVRSYSLVFEPPVPSPAFIERWLETEIAIADYGVASMHSADAFRQLTGHGETAAQKIRSFLRSTIDMIDDVAQDEEKTFEELPFRLHPAVDRIGFRVTWRGSTFGEYEHIIEIPVERYRIDDRGQLAHIPIDELRRALTLEIVSSGDALDNLEKTRRADLREIVVGPEEFVSVLPLSLANAAFFRISDRLPRFNEKLAPLEKILRCSDGVERAVFAGKAQWFECAPLWNSVPVLEDALLTIDAPSMARPGTAHLLFDAGSQNLQAGHLLGGTVELHQWHWTGTPVEFGLDADDGHSLKNWIATMSDVGSFRIEKQIIFAEETDVDSGTWQLTPNQVLDSISRTDGASSALVAYTFRPDLRFSAWLNDDDPRVKRTIRTVLATGTLMRGTAPSVRLDTPTAQWSIPLTSGFEKQFEIDERLPKRGKNGVLLVFDQALMRTDERSQFAGVGETIEIDVVETEPYPSENPFVFREIGPNPIFHSAPDPERISQFNISASRPFGLTYDVGSNPRVAQSGVCVFPKGANGEWFLAKMRTRKSILPETLLDYPTEINTRNADLAIGTRIDGEDSVPEDFFIDVFDKKLPDALFVHGQELRIPEVLDEDRNAGPLRLRVTWHKSRWGTPQPPHWRPRIDVQKRAANYLDWTNLDDIATGYDEKNRDFDWDVTTTGPLEVIVTFPTGEGGRFGKLHVSDYSEARWISFIGMFGSKKLDRPDEYILKKSGLSIKLEGCNLPVLQSFDTSSRGNKVPVFNVLNVYRPEETAMNGKLSSSGGKFLGTLSFDSKTGFTGPLLSQNLDGCIGYIMSYQHVTAFATYPQKHHDDPPEMYDEKAWLKLHAHDALQLDQLVFPMTDPERALNQRESVVRPVPQFLGPITIMDDTQS